MATNFFNNLFFNPEFYDLSPVGRLKLDLKLRKPEDRLPLTRTTLVPEDILMAVKELITQKDKEGLNDGLLSNIEVDFGCEVTNDGIKPR